ncbi:MAG: 50S ribosomal protein L21 [Actinomycetota bacterium]|nr:50S ribosomal protein L21 [Actinomycetota bacterium]
MEQGQILAVEKLGASAGDEVNFEPVLLVDGETVVAGASLAGSRVAGRVVGESKGPKIRGFTYKNKSRGRKSWGHRQHYTTVEITGINRGEG